MTTILFDLDGTLIDTTPQVLPAFRKTLAAFDVPIPADAVLRSTYGMPDDEIWAMLMPEASAARRKEAFHHAEAQSKAGMFEQDLLFPHVREVLSELVARGCVLTTASNCGQPYLDAVLDSQAIRPFFTHPLCLESVGGARKADILRTHFERFDKSSAVMIGDRASDIEAANEHGVPTIACTFGFGTPAELAGAIAHINDLRELLALFPAGHLRSS